MKLALGLVVVFAIVAGGTLTLSGPEPPPSPALEATAAMRGRAALDGLTFTSQLGPAGKPFDVNDTLIFDDGLFVSTECEKRCNYPARPYYTRKKGDAIEFFSETRCPDKDAKLVWRGTVDSGSIKGEFIWISSRWYWTFEKTYWFEGVVHEKTSAIERP